MKKTSDLLQPRTKNIAEQDLPCTENAAYLPYREGEFTSPYDEQAEALRNEILSLKDTPPKTETVYYISYKGDDSNDGLSPETAWATTACMERINEDSTVLLERGGVYRGGFELKSNVFYGAYGEGPKPCIYGSLQNYAEEALWEKYSENIWRIKIDGSEEVGSIIFDHGVVSAIKIIDVTEAPLEQKLTALNKDYTFYYAEGSVYLYLSGFNPATLHNSIEIMDRKFGGCIMHAQPNLKNVVIENLCLKYANFGIAVGVFNDHVTIRGCEIGYIGGCISSNKIFRWGNGIEFWGAENLTVENCWIYQCYDAGFTHQADGGAPHKNITVRRNLFEFSQYNIEVWNKDGSIENAHYHDNIFRFAGYQVFDPKVRHGSDSSATANVQNPIFNTEYNNFVIENNIFDTSYGYLLFAYNPKITVRNNSWVQQPQQATYFYDSDGYKIVPSVMRKDGDAVTALNKEKLENGVRMIDSEPESILYINNNKGE